MTCKKQLFLEHNKVILAKSVSKAAVASDHHSWTRNVLATDKWTEKLTTA